MNLPSISLLLLQDGGCETRGYLLLSSYPHLLLQDGGYEKRSLRLDLLPPLLFPLAAVQSTDITHIIVTIAYVV